MIKIDKPDSFILKDKVRVVTEMCVWEMLHSDNSLEIQVKIGRYNKPSKDLVNKICRSELTLDSEELNNFLINLFSNKNFKFNFEQIKNDAYKQKIIESLNNPENKQILLSFFSSLKYTPSSDHYKLTVEDAGLVVSTIILGGAIVSTGGLSMPATAAVIALPAVS